MNKEKAALLSIISNSILITMKLSAGILIGSISVISEAIHSSLDLIASFIAFFSIRKASKLEDEEHPFGYGKYENVSGFAEAMLIFFAAFFIISEAVKKLIYGSALEGVELGLIVMFISSLINLVISVILMRTARNTSSIALEADAIHLFTDVITTAGVFVGLLLVKFTGLKIIDSITAICVALLIINTAFDLTKKSLLDLVDSKLPNEDINKILEVITSHNEIKGYHRLRTRKSGQKKEIDIHLKLSSSYSFTQAHEICSHIESDIKEIFPNSYILIHAEPSTIVKKI